MNIRVGIIICTLGTFAFSALGYKILNRSRDKYIEKDKIKKMGAIGSIPANVLDPKKLYKPLYTNTNQRNRNSKRFLFDASESSMSSSDYDYGFNGFGLTKNKTIRGERNEISEDNYQYQFLTRNNNSFISPEISMQIDRSVSGNFKSNVNNIQKTCSMNCEVIKSFMEFRFETIKEKYDCLMQNTEYSKLVNLLIELERLIAYFYFSQRFKKENILIPFDYNRGEMGLECYKIAYFDPKMRNFNTNLKIPDSKKILENIRDTILRIIEYHSQLESHHIPTKKTISSKFRFEKLNDLENLQSENLPIEKFINFNNEKNMTENKNLNTEYKNSIISSKRTFLESKNENTVGSKNKGYSNSNCSRDVKKDNSSSNMPNSYLLLQDVENKDKITVIINNIITLFEDRAKKLSSEITLERLIKAIKENNIETLWKICDRCKIISEMAIFESIPLENNRKILSMEKQDTIKCNPHDLNELSKQCKNTLINNRYQKQ